MRSTNARHTSWISVFGWKSAIRLTTSAAVTSALSVRSGMLAWPGVPCTRIVHQYVPFSPTMTGSFGPPAVGIGNRIPPNSVMQ